MPRILFIACISILIGHQAHAQSTDLDDYGYGTIQDIGNAFCAGDTALSEILMLGYIQKYPIHQNSIFFGRKLAEIYVSRHEPQLAIAILEEVLEIKPKFGYLFYEDSCGFYVGHRSTLKSDVCVALSKVYTSIGENSRALDYLILADTEHLPTYGGCANGMNMSRTNLSLDFADFYIQSGDTIQAINRLLDFFLQQDGDTESVTKRLKSILLCNYSQKQITAEVKHALKHMRIEQDHADSRSMLVMTIFGHTIQGYARDKLRDYKKDYRHHKNIIALMND